MRTASDATRFTDFAGGTYSSLNSHIFINLVNSCVTDYQFNFQGFISIRAHTNITLCCAARCELRWQQVERPWRFTSKSSQSSCFSYFFFFWLIYILFSILCTFFCVFNYEDHIVISPLASISNRERGDVPAMQDGQVPPLPILRTKISHPFQVAQGL